MCTFLLQNGALCDMAPVYCRTSYLYYSTWRCIVLYGTTYIVSNCGGWAMVYLSAGWNINATQATLCLKSSPLVYHENSMLKSMRSFSKMASGWVCCQPIKSQQWTFLLGNMHFIRDFLGNKLTGLINISGVCVHFRNTCMIILWIKDQQKVRLCTLYQACFYK